MKKIYLPIFLTFLMHGCSSMNQKQCAGADWGSLGKKDAMEGKTPDYYGKRAKACQEYGIAPSPEEYKRGRTEYLCKPENALKLGLKNQGMIECPEEMRSGFEIGYKNGYEIYFLSGSLEKTRNGIKKLNQQLKEYGLGKEKITTIQAGLKLLNYFEKDQFSKLNDLMVKNGVDQNYYLKN